jgi:peptide/nickel transport system substrate-binding protein/oligopeptide transport system substrate-binding protein
VGAYFGLKGDDSDTKTVAGQDEPKTTTTKRVPGSATTEGSVTTTPDSPTTTATATTGGGGTLRVRVGELDSIDPMNVFLSDEFLVVNSLFDSLTSYDAATQQLLPAAAERWDVSADSSVWTFHLTEGATFQNGDPVTAADFKYAWERLLDPDGGSSAFYHLAAVKGYDDMLAGTATELSGVDALDDYTLQVSLSYPFAEFGYVVSHAALAPVPRAAVEAEPARFAEMPIGNGPFMMAEPWVPGSPVRTERYARYYGTPALLDGVDFEVIPDEGRAYERFEAGDLDFTTIPFGMVQAASAEYGLSDDGYTAAPGKQVLTGTELSVYYLILNNTAGPLDNTALRQALSLAIDRQEIIDELYEGEWRPATGIVPEGMPGYEDDSWEYCRYDPVDAAAKLVEAGYADGQGLPQIVISCSAAHESVMKSVAEHLAALGVDASVDTIDGVAYYNALYDGDFMVARSGWMADYPIIDTMLYPLFATGSGDNLAFFSDPTIDQQLLDARATADPAARLAAYRAVDRALGEACPVIPLAYYSHHHVASDRVQGLVFGPLGDMNLDKVWIEEQ